MGGVMNIITAYEVDGQIYKDKDEAKLAHKKSKLREMLSDIWYRDMDYEEVIDLMIDKSDEIYGILED